MVVTDFWKPMLEGYAIYYYVESLNGVIVDDNGWGLGNANDVNGEGFCDDCAQENPFWALILEFIEDAVVLSDYFFDFPRHGEFESLLLRCLHHLDDSYLQI
jgi:hypothetical protein